MVEKIAIVEAATGGFLQETFVFLKFWNFVEHVFTEHLWATASAIVWRIPISESYFKMKC